LPTPQNCTDAHIAPDLTLAASPTYARQVFHPVAMTISRQRAEKKSVPAPHLYIGPAGWSYPDWKRILYPDPRPKDFHEATFLSEFFDTIEINTSFYHQLNQAHAEQRIER